jgi:hypothetical protein
MLFMTRYLLRIKNSDQVLTENDNILTFANEASADLHIQFGAIPDGIKREDLTVDSCEVE